MEAVSLVRTNVCVRIFALMAAPGKLRVNDEAQDMCRLAGAKSKTT